ncbi:MAG: hypothetical protein AAF840_03375 [Bacteroidota bacterium]
MPYKSTLIQNHHARAQERLAGRSSFIGRNLAIWIFVTWILYPIGASLSAFTEGYYVYYILGDTALPSIRLAITILFCVMIEGAVLFLGKGAIDDLQAGALAGTGGERFLFTIKVIGFFICFGLSIFLSLRGGPQFQEEREKNHNPVAEMLTLESDAEAIYASDKATQEQIIADSRNTKWKGTITGSAMKAMRAAQAEVTRINGLIEAQKVRIRQENEQIKTEYAAELATTTSQAFTLTGVGQIVVFFCILFNGLFNQEVEREFGGTKGAAAGAMAGTSSRPIGFGVPAPAAHHPAGAGTHPDPTAERRAIGFKNYEDYPTPPDAGSSSSKLIDDIGIETATPGTPEAGGISTVATSSYSEETDDGWPLAAISHLNSYRAYKKEESIYASRTTLSAKKSLVDVRKGLAHEQEQLAQLGLYVHFEEEPRKRYVLKRL